MHKNLSAIDTAEYTKETHRSIHARDVIYEQTVAESGSETGWQGHVVLLTRVNILKNAWWIGLIWKKL